MNQQGDLWDGGTKGRALKEEALGGHEDRHPDKLALARAFAVSEYYRIARRTPLGQRPYVTSDHIRKFCDEHGIARGPWMGAVFRGSEWSVIGFTTSKDPIQHSTALRMWQHV